MIRVSGAQPSSAAEGSPLSEEHLRQLAAAGVALGKIRRVVSIARFDGWTVAIFAGLTALFGITDPTTLVIAGVMGCIAVVELRGAEKFRRLDVNAPRVLAMNQIALGSLLILYAVGRIYAELTGPGIYEALAAADPQLSRMLQPVQELTHTIALAAYGALILVAVAAQGGLALFYFTRQKLLAAYLRQTPAWITSLHRSAVAG